MLKMVFRRCSRTPLVTGFHIWIIALCVVSAGFAFASYLQVERSPVDPGENPLVFTWTGSPAYMSRFSGLLYDYQFAQGGSSPVHVTFPLRSWEVVSTFRASFADLWGFAPIGASWTPQPAVDVRSGQKAVIASGDLIIGDYFKGTGQRTVFGRVLDATDETHRNMDVVISSALARELFGSETPPLGTLIEIEGSPYSLVGVAAAGENGEVKGSSSDFWIPMSTRDAVTVWGAPSQFAERPDFFGLVIAGHLKRGVTIEPVLAKVSSALGRVITMEVTHTKEMMALHTNMGMSDLNSDSADAGRGSDASAVSIHLSPSKKALNLVGGHLHSLIIMLGLIAAFATFSGGITLSLVTTQYWMERRRELGMKMAFASGPHVYGEILIDSIIKSFIGACIGLVIAGCLIRVVTRAFLALLQPYGIQMSDLHISVLAAASCIALGIMLGIMAPAPVIAYLQRARLPDLLSTSRVAGHSRRADSILWSCALAQICLSACMLLIACIGHTTVSTVLHRSLGFQPDGLTIAQVTHVAARVPASTQRPSLTLNYLDILRKLKENNQISAVSLSTIAPLTMQGAMLSVRPVGSNERFMTKVSLVGPDYISTMGMQLVGGRDIGYGDTPSASSVAVANEAFIRRIMKTQGGGLGSRVAIDGMRGATSIVGVVRNAAYENVYEFGEAVDPVLYIPLAQYDSVQPKVVYYEIRGYFTKVQGIMARATTPLSSSQVILGHIAQERALMLRSLSPQLAMSDITTVGSILILLISVSGIAGIMWLTVGRQRRVIAIRRALGQPSANLVTGILKKPFYVAVVGAIVALPLVLAFYRIGQHWFDELDLPSPALTLVVLICVVILGIGAGLVPALKALRLEVATVLKDE